MVKPLRDLACLRERGSNVLLSLCIIPLIHPEFHGPAEGSESELPFGPTSWPTAGLWQMVSPRHVRILFLAHHDTIYSH